MLSWAHAACSPGMVRASMYLRNSSWAMSWLPTSRAMMPLHAVHVVLCDGCQGAACPAQANAGTCIVAHDAKAGR